MVGGRARGRNSVSITKHRIHGVKAGPSREKILFILWIFHPETHESHLPSAQRSPVQSRAAPAHLLFTGPFQVLPAPAWGSD